jgi:hypothetical protein
MSSNSSAVLLEENAKRRRGPKSRRLRRVPQRRYQSPKLKVKRREYVWQGQGRARGRKIGISHTIWNYIESIKALESVCSASTKAQDTTRTLAGPGSRNREKRWARSHGGERRRLSTEPRARDWHELKEVASRDFSCDAGRRG